MATRTFGASSTSHSAFWTVTSRYVDVVAPSAFDGLTSRTIKSTVTPTATPTFTSTYFGYYNDLDVVYAYYPTGAVAESDLEPEYDRFARSSSSAEEYTYLYFSMPVTITAPSSCETPCKYTLLPTTHI